MGVLRDADDQPIVIPIAVFAIAYGGLWAWALLDRDPVLLAGANGDQRIVIYGQLAQSAVAMLAIALTVLAILVALPDREGVRDLRGRKSWPLLQGGLLATAGLCLVLLVASQVAVGVDNADSGREWLSRLILATATAAVSAVLMFGAAFWLALRRSHDPVDPSDLRSAS